MRLTESRELDAQTNEPITQTIYLKQIQNLFGFTSQGYYVRLICCRNLQLPRRLLIRRENKHVHRSLHVLSHDLKDKDTNIITRLTCIRSIKLVLSLSKYKKEHRSILFRLRVTCGQVYFHRPFPVHLFNILQIHNKICTQYETIRSKKKVLLLLLILRSLLTNHQN